MEFDYNDFTVRIKGTRSFTIHLFFEGKVVCTRSTESSELTTSGNSCLGEITSIQKAISISKEIIDRHGQKLKSRRGKTSVENRRTPEIKSQIAGKAKHSKPKLDYSIYFYN